MSEQEEKTPFELFKEKLKEEARTILEDKYWDKDLEEAIATENIEVSFFENDLWDSIDYTQAYYNLIKEICEEELFPDLREEIKYKYLEEQDEKRMDSSLRNTTISKIRRGEY